MRDEEVWELGRKRKIWMFRKCVFGNFMCRGIRKRGFKDRGRSDLRRFE